MRRNPEENSITAPVQYDFVSSFIMTTANRLKLISHQRDLPNCKVKIPK